MSVLAQPTSSSPPAAAPPPLLEDLRALPRPFWILFIGTFINRFGTFVWPFLTIYLTRRGFSLETAGVAISCYGLGSVLGTTLGGWLADRIGRRNTIVIGAFAAGVTYFLLYFAATLPALIVCVFLAGAASATYHPASSALLADIVPEERRLRAYSALRLALNAGFACGSACAGFLASGSFFWLFAGDALTTCCFAVIALTMLPHGLRATNSNAPWSDALSHMRTNAPFIGLFVGSICLALMMTQFGTTYPQHVLASQPVLNLGGWRLRDTEVYGLLLAWNGFLVVVAELPLTGWIMRFKPERVMAFGYLVQGAALALNIVCRDFTSLFVAMTICTIGEMASAPVSSAMVAQAAPERMRGRYMGALSAAFSIGSVAGPVLGSRLYVASPHALWLACGLLGLIAAVVILAVARRSRG